MLYQKMNLSGQAIYAPKKVFLSKNLSDSPQAPEEKEKLKQPVNNQPEIDNMFEIQSCEFLPLFGQSSTTPKSYCAPSMDNSQFIVNDSNAHYNFPYMDKDLDQQLTSYLPAPSSAYPSQLLPAISSNSFLSPTSIFQNQHSFSNSSSNTGSSSYAKYSKDSTRTMVPATASQVSMIMNQMNSVGEENRLNPVPVPSISSSQAFSMNSSLSSFVNTVQSSSVISSQSASVNTCQLYTMSTGQTSSLTDQVPSGVNVSHVFSGNSSQTVSLSNVQVSSANGHQTTSENCTSCYGQYASLDPYDPMESNNSLSGSGIVAMETEMTESIKQLDMFKDSKHLEQHLVNSSSSSQTSLTTTSSVGQCDSTQSPLGMINSPESWSFSPLVPFNMTHDGSFDEGGSPFMPEMTSDSTLDLFNNRVKTPVSLDQSMPLDEHLDSTLDKTKPSNITFAQRYGINIKSKLKKMAPQSLRRVSLADIEEFSTKCKEGKRKSVVDSPDSSLLGPLQPKKPSNCPVDEKSSANFSSVISSSQVTSTNINHDLSPEMSYQNKMELFPTSSSDVSAVAPKIYKTEDEERSKISSTRNSIDFARVQNSEEFCQVCGDKAAGFYCGAFICEACKKFFMRASKLEKIKYVCLRVQKCVITKESRVQCQYCRFQKCLSLNMYCPGTGDGKKKDKKIGEIPCRVCSAPSSGFHFGALTCEGCKGFFRRMAKERECQRYKCSKNGKCDVNTITRNLCKACRYRKCLESGMSIEGSRIGRQPNSIKHAISIEAEKQGKNFYKEEIVDEKVDIKDMDALVNTAVPATAAELAEITMDIQPEQLDLTHGDIKTQQTPDICDKDVTPALIGPTEIKQEPQSPMAKSVCSPSTFTDHEKNLEILKKCADCNEELEHLLPVNTDTEENELNSYTTSKDTWVAMMASFEHTARTLIKFSKKVPGFRALSLDDQIKLIQGSIYPIVVLNCSRSFDMETQQYSYFNFTPRQRETIHSFFPSLRILCSHFIHTGTMGKLLNLSTMEYTFLSILLLLNADVDNLNDPERVGTLQMDVLFALQYHEETNFPDGMTRFGMLLARLAELHFILMQHNSAITIMLKKNPELTLPQMYKEMFGEKVLES